MSKLNGKKGKDKKKLKDQKSSLEIRRKSIVGLVMSRFNSEITERLAAGAVGYLEELDLEIRSVRVPGAVEIPLAVKALFDSGCEAVVTVGAVIRGETSHYDVVCNSVERGVTSLMLEYGRPIGFGVLTTDTEEQAMERAGGKHGNKGREAAEVAMEMLGLIETLRKDLARPRKKAKNKSQ